MKSSCRIRFSKKKKKKTKQQQQQQQQQQQPTVTFFFLFHIDVSSKVYCSNFRIPRVTGSFYFDTLPSSRHGFYFVVQNGCSGPTQHIHIPASWKEKERKNVTHLKILCRICIAHVHLCFIDQNLVM